MKAIIFDDRENSNRSLSRLNQKREYNHKRFFKIELFHNFIFKKVESLLKNTNSLELIKTLVYTGEYNIKALTNAKRNCGSEIKKMNDLIEKEDILLSKINKITGQDELKKEVVEHVNSLKYVFQDIKSKNIRVIEQQTINANAQKKLFDYIKTIPFTELRTTPLVTRQGIIQQKGVDAKFSTDLILLAQSNAFDVAILLTGDADLKESIKLIRERYGKLVFIVAYNSQIMEEKKFNTIGEDLIKECDFFINLYELEESDLQKISEIKREKRNIAK